MNILIGFLTAIHVLVALFMVVLVLMQKSKDQGVGAAFGGGVTDTVFGAGTTTALVRMTIWCACIFLAGSLVLTVLHAHRNTGGRGSVMEGAIPQPVPAGSMPALPLPEPESVPPTAPATPPATAAPATAPAPAAAPATPPAEKPQP